MHFALATPAASPTFMSQYGPLIAALVALFGVLITLTVNVRSNQTRYREQREDDYRRDQRTAVAAIAVAEHNFLRECGALVDLDNWPDHHDSADAAMAALLNELTVTRLLFHDPTLQGCLDDVYTMWDSVSKAMDALEDAFLNYQQNWQKAAASLQETLDGFHVATSELYTAALDKLKPTVVENR